MKAERKAVKEWLRTMDRGEYERMLRDALFTETDFDIFICDASRVSLSKK